MIKSGVFVHSLILCCRLPGNPCFFSNSPPLFQQQFSAVSLGQDSSVAQLILFPPSPQTPVVQQYNYNARCSHMPRYYKLNRWFSTALFSLLFVSTEVCSSICMAAYSTNQEKSQPLDKHLGNCTALTRQNLDKQKLLYAILCGRWDKRLKFSLHCQEKRILFQMPLLDVTLTETTFP